MTLPFKNTQSQYGSVGRGFHWVTAVLIFGLLISGFFMVDMAFSPFKLEIYGWHKSFGLLVLFLGLGRFIWRFVSVPPAHLDTHALWERLLSKTIQFVFYISIIGMPLSGWAMSNAGEYPAQFFGLFDMPQIVGKDETVFESLKTMHSVFAYGLVGAISLHMLGALKHHVIDKDQTLTRIGGSTPLLALMVLFFAFPASIAAINVIQSFQANRVHESEDVGVTLSSLQSVSDEPLLMGREWVIDSSGSSVNFAFSQYGQSISGSFDSWDGSILFEPEGLDDSKVRILIDPTSIQTGSADRDLQAKGAEWFAVEDYAQIVFESQRFEVVKPNHFHVYGRLTLRGISQDVDFPFTLDISEDDQGHKIALMTAEFSLDRLDFGVGQGQWKSTEAIGNAVKIRLNVQASQ